MCVGEWCQTLFACSQPERTRQIIIVHRRSSSYFSCHGILDTKREVDFQDSSFKFQTKSFIKCTPTTEHRSIAHYYYYYYYRKFLRLCFLPFFYLSLSLRHWKTKVGKSRLSFESPNLMLLLVGVRFCTHSVETLFILGCVYGAVVRSIDVARASCASKSASRSK